MAYNRWIRGHTYYDEELLHYGVLGMRWGVRKARYYKSHAEDRAYRPEVRSEYQRRLNATVGQIREKSFKKLAKYEQKYSKLQSKANREYEKAQKKAYGFLSNKDKADKVFEKAARRQYKANKILYRERRWFDRMSKAYKDIDIDIDSEMAKTGEEIVRRVLAQSQTLYAAERKRR